MNEPLPNWLLIPGIIAGMLIGAIFTGFAYGRFRKPAPPVWRPHKRRR